MDTTLVGRAKELAVAAALTRNGIYVYMPLVDKGADLIATNNSSTLFIPVQVRYRSDTRRLILHRDDASWLVMANAIAAFLVDQAHWYLPIGEWRARAVDNQRADDKLVVNIADHREWLALHEGDAGIRRVFARLRNSSRQMEK